MSSPPPLRARWMWVAAVLLLAAEFMIFDRATSRHHARYYPRWNDQIQYLSESYRGYEDAKAHGFVHGLQATLTNPVPQGTLHDVAALFVFTVAGGPSRSAALSLNMLAFLAWQAALLFAFTRASGSWTVGWMAFGLLPCLYWPWSAEAGSAVDFRLDHSAMCLLGLSAATAVLTRGFRAAGWSAALGVALGFTVIERFLTSVYLVPIFFLTIGWILCGPEKRLRLRNLFLAGLVTSALVGPVFWMNRHQLYEYYWVGQVSSAEAAARLPGYTLWQSVQFVFLYFREQQLGPWFLGTVTVLTLPLLGLALWSRRRDRAASFPRPDWDWLYLSLVFFAVPTLVLCVHQQKSNIVLGVMVPGAILFVGWVWAVLWPRAAATLRALPTGRFGPVVFAVVAVYAGARFFCVRQFWQPHSQAFIEGSQRVNHLSDYFFDHSRAAGLATARIGVDQVTDAFDAQIMRVVCYERKGIWMPYQMLLPTGILEAPEDVIMERLRECDFVLVTDEMVGHGHWPYDKQMRRLYPTVKAWCEANLRHVETFPIFDRKMSLYQRRDISGR
ncbi:MAG TPA: hypothetical protein VG734_02560 [Lacunisphaera sp.]|nr:hypothetical protein [Lacunisphaera sp.]